MDLKVRSIILKIGGELSYYVFSKVHRPPPKRREIIAEPRQRINKDGEEKHGIFSASFGGSDIDQS